MTQSSVIPVSTGIILCVSMFLTQTPVQLWRKRSSVVQPIVKQLRKKKSDEDNPDTSDGGSDSDGDDDDESQKPVTDSESESSDDDDNEDTPYREIGVIAANISQPICRRTNHDSSDESENVDIPADNSDQSQSLLTHDISMSEAEAGVVENIAIPGLEAGLVDDAQLLAEVLVEADDERFLEGITPDVLEEEDAIEEDEALLTQERRVAQNMVEIGHRVYPDVPPPDPTVQDRDADGFSLIGRVGAWSCLLVKFSMLDTCPEQHQEQWVSAWEEVLRRWRDADSDEEANYALMWWMILPQVVLRKPFRGGRGGRSLVAKRFNFLVQGNWGALLSLWVKDCEELARSRQRRGRRGRRTRQEIRNQDQQLKKKNEILSYISAGHVSKAMRRLNSFGVADAKDPAVQDQLRQKYPPRGRPIPDQVIAGDAVDNLSNLRESMSGLKAGVAPGCGGLRPEYAVLLGQLLSAGGMEITEKFGMDYLPGQLPDWFYRVIETVQTVGLFKTAGQTTIRPLGLKHTFVKVLHKEVFRQNRKPVVDVLQPQQLGQSKGGAAKLVFSVRALLESNPEFICVRLDLRNAFNEEHRAACIEVCQSKPSLSHLTHFMGITLTPVSGMESGGERWGETAEGATQGDPASSFEFNLGLQPSLETLDEECAVGGGSARAGCDDIYAVGLPDVVLPAVGRFKVEVKQRCGLELEWSKSEVFCWQGDLPPEIPDGLKLAGEQKQDDFLRGFMCYGVPVGEEQYVKMMLMDKAKEIVEDAAKAVEMLGSHKQSLWSCLRLSICHRFDYWLQLCRPSDILPAATWLDEQLWLILQHAVGFTIPRVGEGRDWDIVLQVPGREGLTYQEWLVRQPIKCGGMGMRSLVETSRVAFLGALEIAIPSFTGEDQICEKLEGVVQRWAIPYFFNDTDTDTCIGV